MYLFIPNPPRSYTKLLQDLRTMISAFIFQELAWKPVYKRPQFGGLKLSDVQLYYWAAQSRTIWLWQTEQNKLPCLEATTAAPHICCTTGRHPLFIQSCYSLKNNTHNPFIKHTSSIWFAHSETSYNDIRFHTNPHKDTLYIYIQ